MYSFFDYDNDRARVRDRFINEMNRKTSISEIGEILDKFVLDEKAEGFKFYDPVKALDDKPKMLSQDVSNFDLTWSGRYLNSLDPLVPCILNFKY